VAPDLLGCWLLRRSPEGLMGGPIVETEAYVSGDPACHAAPGPTERNRVMFGPPGYSYVYFIYGCHYCVNVVCMPTGIGEAVLIRAIEPRLGLDLLKKNRRAATEHLTNGPGKLCAAMGITRKLNGLDLCDTSSALHIARGTGDVAGYGKVLTSTRIGITKAANLPLRFYFQGNAFVSRKR
jgi:DNA-3-methyladenine glycosylase